MATIPSRQSVRELLRECRERLNGWWHVPNWLKPIAIAFLIQTSIHYVLFSLHLLQLNRRLPFTDPGSPYSLEDIITYMQVPPESSPLLAQLVGLLVVAPLLEELWFRLPVWVTVALSGNRVLQWFIVMGPALAWAVLHGRALFGTLEVFTGGILAGWLVLRTKNLVPAMLFHSLWNLSIVVKSLLGIV